MQEFQELVVLIRAARRKGLWAEARGGLAASVFFFFGGGGRVVFKAGLLVSVYFNLCWFEGGFWLVWFLWVYLN